MMGQSDSLSYAYFSLDNCNAQNGSDQQFDYSEFTAQLNNDGACADMAITSGYLSVDKPHEDMHSCTPGVDGDRAMCVGAFFACAFVPNSDKTLRVDVQLTPSSDIGAAVLSGLSFYERAPQMYVWINSPSGPNNYPTLFGVRVLKNGTEVFRSEDNPTQFEWNQWNFDFSEMPAFKVTEPTHSPSNCWVTVQLTMAQAFLHGT